MEPQLASPFELKQEELSTMIRMLEMLFGRKPGNTINVFSSLFSQQSSSSFSLSVGGNQPAPGIWVKEFNATHFFAESESTSFSSVGIAKTQDGREINFNINMEMSRSFMEYTNISWQEEVLFKDPLVINLDSNPTSLSDQKFAFDIDSDGEADNISQLNKGSGYLALDKNNDGKINDGNELFGAKTGNGFEELTAYDKDKNGWIDENDEIYNKLKVWIKDASGNDKLINLKEADIGAIYLGNSITDFTLKSMETGKVNGQVRNTGLYLKESTGAAGTVQQIDVSV